MQPRTGSATDPAAPPCSAFSGAPTASPETLRATMPTSETRFPAQEAATRRWRKSPRSARPRPRLTP
eukprot:5673789-Alexandrium_andersonii.AAC.1